MYTPIYGLKLLHQNQSQKEMVINENFSKIERMLNFRAESMNIDIPPNKPCTNSIYIIPANAQKEWQDYPLHIAEYQGKWFYSKPSDGMMIWVHDTAQLVLFHNDAWHTVYQCSNFLSKWI
jgi:hypothetical protein